MFPETHYFQCWTLPRCRGKGITRRAQWLHDIWADLKRSWWSASWTSFNLGSRSFTIDFFFHYIYSVFHIIRAHWCGELHISTLQDGLTLSMSRSKICYSSSRRLATTNNAIKSMALWQPWQQMLQVFHQDCTLPEYRPPCRSRSISQGWLWSDLRAPFRDVVWCRSRPIRQSPSYGQAGTLVCPPPGSPPWSTRQTVICILYV